MDNLVRYSKELIRTIQTAGIGSKACRRRNRVPSRSFSTLNQAESSYPVKSNRLLIKNGPIMKCDKRTQHSESLVRMTVQKNIIKKPVNTNIPAVIYTGMNNTVVV